MRKNVASQVVDAQLNSRTDGSPVTTGTTTVYVSGDGGPQVAVGGSPSCVHLGNGLWSYIATAAESNYDHVSFTFVNSAAVCVTIQIYPSYPQTGDNFARIGAPAGASVSADIAATKALLPTALVGGKMDSHISDIAANAITATSIAADAITDAKVASDVTIASVTGAVGSVTGAVGSVTGAVGSVATGGIAAASFAAGAINAAAIAADAITAAKVADGTIDAATFAAGAINAAAIAADAITDAKVASDVTIASVTGAVGSVTGAVGSVTGNVDGNVNGSVASVAAGGITAASFAADAITAAKIAADVTTELQAGLATSTAVATLQTSVDDIPTNAELATALGTADDAVLAQIALVKAKTDNLPTDPADASDIAGAFGTVNSTLATIATYVDTEVAAIKVVTDKLNTTLESTGSPTDYVFTKRALEQVWDAVIVNHLTVGSTGLALNSAGSAGDPWATSLPGAYGAGTAGKLIGDNVNATISSRATQTSVDTIDDFLDTEIAAIKAKTDNLPVDPADASDIAGAFSTVNATLATIATYVDTEVASIKVVTDKLNTTLESTGSPTDFVFTARALAQAPSGTGASAIAIADEVQTRTIAAVTMVNGLAANTVNASAVAADAVAEIQSGLATASALSTVNTTVNAIDAKTTNLPSDPADQSLIIAATNAIVTLLGTPAGISLAADVAAVKGDTGAVKVVTDKLGVMVELGSGSPTYYRFSTTALEQAGGGSAPTVGQIADAVWDEAIASHLAVGSTGEALSDAGAAGNPWNNTAEGTLTFGDLVRLVAAVAVGKDTITDTGNETATVVFRDASDLSDIITAYLVASRRVNMVLAP